MGPAFRLQDFVFQELLVARLVIDLQRAAPVFEKLPCMFARPALTEDIDHRLHLFVSPGCVGP